MKCSAQVEVGTDKGDDYRGRNFEKIFTATVEGESTEEVEKKVALLQEAATHKGWRLK